MAPLLHRDGLLLFLAKFLRAFVYGILTVSLGIYLRGAGFSLLQIGLIVSFAVLGNLVSTILVALLSDRFGRRKSLTILSLLMVITGTVLATTTDFWPVALAVFVGSISLTGGEIGPFLSLEQSIIPQISSEENRNRAFSLYNFVGYIGLSVGSVSVPAIPKAEATSLVQASYLPVSLSPVVLGIVLSITYQLLGLRVEALPSNLRSRFTVPHSSRRVVLKLSGLFGLDAFGGGFIPQLIIALWFSLVFNLDPQSIGLIIAAGQAITALSILVAGPLANRFGLLNTMVLTHIASNVLLASIPFAPTLYLAVGLYLSRQSLSQMDVPTRQAYTMALVPADERTPAAGITTLSRNISQSTSPTFAGYLESLPGFLWAPFVVAGGIKVLYDLLLYRSFRHVALPEGEQPTTVT